MPKAEKGTPKDIANRIKAKGLQKLKFYCQMCQKQCRDQNGFKCHLTSESHLRQMKIFSGNAMGIVDKLSKEFEKAYLDTLRQRHGTKRVSANNVYQEVIQDRHHIHMNATKWATLTDFCQYLGKTGKCVVDETERGWYVQYIERDASILARQEEHQRRVQAEKASEERLAKQMEIQRVEAARALDRAGGTLHAEATNLDRADTSQPVSLSLNANVAKKRKKNASASGVVILKGKSVLDEQDDDDDGDDEQHEPEDSKPPPALPKTILPRGQHQDSRATRTSSPREKASGKVSLSRKRKRTTDADEVRKENWIRTDILVRIISKKFAGGKYYKRKAAIDRVLDDKFTAEVEVLDSGRNERDGGDVLRLDQDDLETIVPKEGKEVLILNGPGRGKRATLISADKKNYRATLELEDGRRLERVDFEDFSKIA